MPSEFFASCKDCVEEYGYSDSFRQQLAERRMDLPERCAKHRAIHSRIIQTLALSHYPIPTTDEYFNPRRLVPLGRLRHGPRVHNARQSVSKLPQYEFGITEKDIDKLYKSLEDHQVVVIEAPTGSGKSTFLPYRLLTRDGNTLSPFARQGQILVTQPRTKATEDLACFVGQKLHGGTVGPGFDVGFRHRAGPHSDARNRLVFMTDGIALNQIVSEEIQRASILMIDEAHERSANIDLILALLGQRLHRLPDLKVIVASATIDAAVFVEHFGGVSAVGHLKFEGKQHEVRSHFQDQRPDKRDMPEVVAVKILSILREIAVGREDGGGQRREGDVLAFLPGKDEIRKAITAVKDGIADDEVLRDRGIEALPLHREVVEEDQRYVTTSKAQLIADRLAEKLRSGSRQVVGLFLSKRSMESAREILTDRLADLSLGEVVIRSWPEDSETDMTHGASRTVWLATFDDPPPEELVGERVTDRKVIVATNVAETSLTVDGVVYVVDSGLIKQKAWDPTTCEEPLLTRYHSRAGCLQRKGRAGRVMSGEAFHLYPEDELERQTPVRGSSPAEFIPAHTTPEVYRTNLEKLVLTAFAAGVHRLDGLQWMKDPNDPDGTGLDLQKEFIRSTAALNKVGALKDVGRASLTELGLELQRFDSLEQGRLMILADRLGCAVEMATVLSMTDFGWTSPAFQIRRTWNAPTRRFARRCHAALKDPCDDDVDLVLKLFAGWAGEIDPDCSGEAWGLSHCLDVKRFDEKVRKARDALLEPLCKHTRYDKPRNIDFTLAERVRFVLAICLTERIYHRKGSQFRAPPLSEEAGVARRLKDVPAKRTRLVASDALLVLASKAKQRQEDSRRYQVDWTFLVRVKSDWIEYTDDRWPKHALAWAGERGDVQALDVVRLLSDQYYRLGARVEVTHAHEAWSLVRRIEPFGEAPISVMLSTQSEGDLGPDDSGEESDLIGLESGRLYPEAEDDIAESLVRQSDDLDDEEEALRFAALLKDSAREKLVAGFSGVACRTSATPSDSSPKTGVVLKYGSDGLAVIAPDKAPSPLERFAAQCAVGDEIDVEVIADEDDDDGRSIVVRHPGSDVEIVVDGRDLTSCTPRQGDLLTFPFVSALESGDVLHCRLAECDLTRRLVRLERLSVIQSKVLVNLGEPIDARVVATLSRGAVVSVEFNAGESGTVRECAWMGQEVMGGRSLAMGAAIRVVLRVRPGARVRIRDADLLARIQARIGRLNRQVLVVEDDFLEAKGAVPYDVYLDLVGYGEDSNYRADIWRLFVSSNQLQALPWAPPRRALGERVTVMIEDDGRVLLEGGAEAILAPNERSRLPVGARVDASVMGYEGNVCVVSSDPMRSLPVPSGRMGYEAVTAIEQATGARLRKLPDTLFIWGESYEQIEEAAQLAWERMGRRDYQMGDKLSGRYIGQGRVWIHQGGIGRLGDEEHAGLVNGEELDVLVCWPAALPGVTRMLAMEVAAVPSHRIGLALGREWSIAKNIMSATETLIFAPRDAQTIYVFGRSIESVGRAAKMLADAAN